MASKLEQARLKDFDLEEEKKAKVNLVQDEKKSLKCVKCRESGHHKDECQKGWKCLKCDEFGHKAVDCSEN